MNQRIIWSIVTLMSIAVVGVVWLQIDLIRSAARVNEERFEKNVYDALNAVTARLEEEERKEIYNYTTNGFAQRFFQREYSSGNNSSILSFDIESSLSVPKGLAPFRTRDLNTNPFSDEDINAQRWKDMYIKNLSKRLLVDRIRLDYIEEALKQELSNRGININYDYAVYSKKKKSHVIINGNYAVEENQPNAVMNTREDLFNSRYQIALFPQEVPSPGWLKIFFPNKVGFFWESLLLNLIFTVLLAGLIIGCFAYVISVIFKQKKLSEMKTDFINNMTHEFKTPIATISLATDSITSPMIAGNPDKVQRFANIIRQENKRMNSQVEKVLQMAQIDKREFSLKLTDINLHEVVARAVENISLQVERKDGKVKTELEATKPIIEGDLTHISNMINNLLDNANKYTPDNPEILVTTRNVPNGVEVIVKDNGIGMTKEVRKHIFDKFYRVHTGNLHDIKGFGLGLSYVKAMITAHKGQIDVKSELGKGSSFILTFPNRISN
ncbi:MAG: HAMP domain-containing sensor histidine kinase [Bacteroidota bacterium]